MKIFKYYSVTDNSKKVLTAQEIFFSKPSKLNDPFELGIKPTFDLTNSEMKERNYTPEKVELLKKQYSEKNYINFLIRDHFKDIGIFCATETYTNALMWSHYGNSHTGFCVEIETDGVDELKNPLSIEYKNDPLKYNVIKGMPQRDFFKRKHKDWGYEKEVRFLIEKFGPITIPKANIKKIYLGLDAEHHQELIRLIERNLTCGYTYMKKNPNSFELAI